MGFFKPNVEKMEKNKDVRGLTKALRSDKHVKGGVLYEAVWALVRIGEPAVEPLIQALKDEDEVIRFGAADTLGRIGNTRAVEPLIEALKDENYAVRGWAALALGRMGDTRAVEPLTEALKDKDDRVVHLAAEALEKLKGEKGARTVIPQEVPAASSTVPVPPQPELTKPPEAPLAKKYCVHCGAEMSAEAVYCPKCGKKLAS